MATPPGRAMAALLSVLAEFKRESLRERLRAEPARARQNGKGLDRPQPQHCMPIESANYAARALANPRSPAASTSVARRCAASLRPRPRMNSTDFSITQHC